MQVFKERRLQFLGAKLAEVVLEVVERAREVTRATEEEGEENF